MQDWFSVLINEFGDSIQLQNLQADANGIVSLHFIDGGQVLIERQEEGLQVSILKASEPFDLLPNIERGLEMCHYKKGMDFPVRPGMIGDETLVYSIYLDTDKATVNNLDQAVFILKDVVSSTMMAS